jgi:hypothetical protein
LAESSQADPLPAPALKKSRPSFLIRLTIVGAATGFVLAALVCVGAYYVTSVTYRTSHPDNLFPIDDRVWFLACPPSFGAMALEGAGVPAQIVGWILIAVINVGLYGVAGLCIGAAIDWIYSWFPISN